MMIYNKDKIGLKKCVKSLNENKIIFFPTETVFGVASSLDNHDGLMELKNRPANKAFPVCVGNYEMIYDLCNLSKFQINAVNKLLPGPITLILPLKKPLNDKDTVAIRFSDDKFIKDMINLVNKPIYLTSANMSGQEPYKSASDASKTFKDKIDTYIEGSTNFDIASTIIDLTNDSIKIIRQGPISLKDIENMLGGN